MYSNRPNLAPLRYNHTRNVGITWRVHDTSCTPEACSTDECAQVERGRQAITDADHKEPLRPTRVVQAGFSGRYPQRVPKVGPGTPPGHQPRRPLRGGAFQGDPAGIRSAVEPREEAGV